MTNTKLNFSAFFLLFCFNINAQVNVSDFKIGDTWTYTDWIDGNCDDRPRYQYSIIGDTLIEAKTYSILAIKENEIINEKSKILLFSKNGLIHFYEKGNNYLLYDFTASVGDTLMVYLPSNAALYNPSSLILQSPQAIKLEVIDTDSIKSDENKWLKKITTQPAFIQNDSCIEMNEIYEGIGSKTGLFGFSCNTIATGCFGELMCFSSQDLNLNLSGKPCNGKNATLDTKDEMFKIFPNPTSNRFTIASNLHFDQIKLYKLDGQLHKDIRVSDEKSIEIEAPSNQYIAMLMKNNHVITYKLIAVID